MLDKPHLQVSEGKRSKHSKVSLSAISKKGRLLICLGFESLREWENVINGYVTTVMTCAPKKVNFTTNVYCDLEALHNEDLTVFLTTKTIFFIGQEIARIFRFK